MNINQCISNLKENPRVGAEKSAKFWQQSVYNYNDYRAKNRHLQNEHLINILGEDPDALLNYIWDVILDEA